MPKTEITLSQALIGYELAAAARHLSPHTIADYQNTFRKFTASLPADLPISQITPAHINLFFAAQEVSKKTLLNYHVGLSALWAWAARAGLVSENLLHQVDRPKPETREIQPFTEFQIRAILSALTYSSVYTRPGQRPTRHRLPDADRAEAIVLLLLDTGLRASELCDLTINRVDLRSPTKTVNVRNGKGAKDRTIPISARTGQAVWKYLTSRKSARFDDPLFTTDTNRSIDRTQLGKMLAAAGDRAGVPDTHPHRFRHTFAIFFLRNGGDIYTLQTILGHTTLDMVKVYLQLAQTDLEAAHRRASPVDNMRL